MTRGTAQTFKNKRKKRLCPVNGRPVCYETCKKIIPTNYSKIKFGLHLIFTTSKIITPNRDDLKSAQDPKEPPPSKHKQHCVQTLTRLNELFSS